MLGGSTALCDALLARAGTARPALESSPDLDACCRELLQSARGRWPGIQVDACAFLDHVGHVLSGSANPLGDLISLQATDLYLAFACLAGDPPARRAFEREYMTLVARFVHVGANQALLDEICQLVRERVLIGAAGGTPKLASYTGRGPLAAWLRVVSLRTAVDLQRMERDWKRTAFASSGGDAGPADPELGYMKAHYAAEFKQAFEDTLSALATRQRMILRMHFIDGVSSNAIGALYDVHPATIVKWLVRIRADILRRTRSLLGERLGLDSEALDSVMGLIQSRLDASISTILRRR
jgi:RNA polymerase sigma-70 factor (ECF subfamily)